MYGSRPAIDKIDLSVPYFIHIPRNAGRSIERWGRDNGYVWSYDAWDLYRDYGIHSCRSLNHIPKLLPFNVVYTFCVIRNPIDRFLSELNFVYGRYREYQLGKKEEYPVSMLIGYEKDRTYLDCHLIPQYEYVYPATTCIKFGDNLDKDLSTYLGEKVELPHIAESVYYYKKEDLSLRVLERLNKLYEKDFKLWESL